MSLISTKEMLIKAQEEGYAVPAFNIHNLETIQVVLDAARDLKSPVILAATPSTVKYADVEFFLANAKVAAEKANAPIAMHLDHGNSFELAIKAFRAGYTSVMIGGSHSSFEENIELTKSVVDVCNCANIPVEAELGKVGGKEDDLDAEMVDIQIQKKQNNLLKRQE